MRTLFHPDWVISGLCFSPTGALLASADTGGNVRLWHLADEPTLPQQLRIPGWRPGYPVHNLAFSPEGRFLVANFDAAGLTGNRREALGYWDLAEQESFTLLGSSFRTGAGFAFRPDGQALYLLVGMYRLRCWRLPDWEAQSPGISAVYPSDNRRIAIASNNRFLAVGGDHPRIDLWDLREAERLGIWVAHPSYVEALAFHPTLPLLASAGPREARLWSVPNGEFVHELPRLGSSQITCLAFAPDGQTLAVGRNRGDVDLWDTQDWQRLNSFRWPIGNVVRLAFSPDGLCLAAGGDRGNRSQIVLWDVR